MNFFKFVVILGLLIYGCFWIATDGVSWYQQYKIESAVEKYKEVEGYYPFGLQLLTKREYKDDQGEKHRYLTTIPIPRKGYCWDYNNDNGRVKLALLPRDTDRTDLRVCP